MYCAGLSEMEEIPKYPVLMERIFLYIFFINRGHALYSYDEVF